MKFLTVCILLFSIHGLAFGQKVSESHRPFKYKNNFQFEARGHGLHYSLGYERLLINTPKWKCSAQISGAYYPPKTQLIRIWVPALLNGMLSFDAHHIELGCGYIFTSDGLYEFGETNPIARRLGFWAARLGYRYQKPDGRFLLRMAVTPFAEHLEAYAPHQRWMIYPQMALSMGIAF